MPRKIYTIRELASKLNTTASTVSRALQDNPRISIKMRQAVQDLARKHNYQPNFRASSLRRGNGKTIGVLVPQIDRHFFATVLNGIDKMATTAGYNVLVCQSFESCKKEVQLVKSLMYGRVDGLIASISIETKKFKHFEQLIASGIPVVFFDRVPPRINASKVVIDDYRGGCMAMEHIINQGCRRIVHFSGPQFISIYYNRTRAYFDSLTKYKLKIVSELIFENVITREAGYSAMQKIMEMPQLPDAIYASGDYSALGAMLCAQKKGISIPDQLVISGFANEPWGSFIMPPLTSIDQHAFDMGHQAVTLVINQIENKNQSFVPRSIILDPELIIRKSTLRQPISKLIHSM